MEGRPWFLDSSEGAFQVGMTLAWNALQLPERVAIVSEHGNRTFSELNARANQAVRALRGRGLRKGDPVALMCGNRPEFVEVYAAALRAGLRIVCVNRQLQAEETRYILEDSEARALIADADVASVVQAVVAEHGSPLVRLAIGGVISGFDDYDEALAEHDGADIGDPSMGTPMLYTSGTTGRPKGVAFPPQPARANVLMSGAVQWDPDHSVSLCTGPLYHAAPLAYSMIAPLHNGVGAVLMTRWDAEQALRLIHHYRVTHAHFVPTMFIRMLRLPPEARTRYDLTSLRFILHGAAPIPVHVKQRLIEWLGPILYEYYAGTEGGGTMITSEEWLRKPGSVGRAGPRRTARILDADGRAVAPGVVGTVFFEVPPEVRFEYFKDPEKTRRAYQGSSFTLGDQGYLDEDGYLFLTGRTAEMIVAGGINIYPAEIDAVLLMHPAVSDVAAVGVPNEEYGEEVKAVVALAPGYVASRELASELIEWSRARLAHFKCPRSVDFVASVPRSDSGKLYRARLRENYSRERT